MDQWLIDLLTDIDERIRSTHGEGAQVHWSTRRRMAYDIRWPPGLQMEAHYDNSMGNPAKLEQLQTEMAAIKAAIPKVEA